MCFCSTYVVVEFTEATTHFPKVREFLSIVSTTGRTLAEELCPRFQIYFVQGFHVITVDQLACEDKTVPCRKDVFFSDVDFSTVILVIRDDISVTESSGIELEFKSSPVYSDMIGCRFYIFHDIGKIFSDRDLPFELALGVVHFNSILTTERSHLIQWHFYFL